MNIIVRLGGDGSRLFQTESRPPDLEALLSGLRNLSTITNAEVVSDTRGAFSLRVVSYRSHADNEKLWRTVLSMIIQATGWRVGYDQVLTRP